MSAIIGKLDQSLDDILKTRRQSARSGGRGRRVANTGKPQTSVSAPVGGVSKNARGAKSNTRAIQAVIPITGTGESKIIVSGLVNTNP